MKKNLILATMFAVIGVSANAQEIPAEEPKGRAIVQVFGNFHSGFGSQNDDRGFELERSYLGYEYNLGRGLSVKGVIDFGKSSDVDDYQRIAYVKNALLKWNKGKFTLCGGLISTTQFNFQEKFWGYRYIRKSFQDEYKFGSSADLGVSATFDFTERFSLDAVILNGEGYKKIQKNDGLNYGLGLTANPVGGFFIRAYGGINQGTEGEQKNTANLASFVGYKHDKFSLGAEFNQMWNTSFKDDEDKHGFSVYANVKVSKIASLYARFDDIFSRHDWNKAKDESNVIFGSQFKVGKYVKLAPNVRLAMPKQEGADNKWSAYINCSFGL